MKKGTYSLLLIILLQSAEMVQAQVEQRFSIEWRIAGEIPHHGSSVKEIGLAGAFSGAANGWIWIGGGANFPEGLPWEGGQKKYHNQIFIFKHSPTSENKIISLKKHLQLPFPVAYGVSVQVDDQVVCAGGQTGTGYSAVVYRAWLQQNDTSFVYDELPKLPDALANAAGTYCNGSIYIAGGENTNGTSNKFYVLDLAKGKKGWETLSDLPVPLSHSSLVTQTFHGKKYIYLIGGRAQQPSGISKFYNNVFRYDTEQNVWTTCRKLPVAISAQTAVAIGNTGILLIGGDNGETFREVERLITAISKTMDTEVKSKLVTEKNKLLLRHPGFSRDVNLYHTDTDTWQVIGKMPMESTVTTSAFFWNGNIIIPSGEVRAGIRSPYILSGKIIVHEKKVQ